MPGEEKGGANLYFKRLERRGFEARKILTHSHSVIHSPALFTLDLGEKNRGADIHSQNARDTRESLVLEYFRSSKINEP